MKTLPYKTLWKLLDVAITDLQSFRKKPGNKVKMSSWMVKKDDVCFACMAGSVLQWVLFGSMFRSVGWDPLENRKAIDDLSMSDVVLP